MITQLREHAQSWIIKILLGLVALTFVISFGMGGFSNEKQVLVKIDSEEILVQEYFKVYEREMEGLRQRFPENAEMFAKQINLRKQVFDKMVNRHLILKAARKNGILITDQEVSDRVQSQEAFHVSGNFDYQTYESILKQNRLTPDGYENQVREDMIVQKFQRNLIAGLVVSKQEIDQRYRIEREKIAVDFIHFDPTKFLGTVKSDPAMEQQYYEANKTRFTQKDQFRVSYFILPLGNLEKSVDIRDRAIERYYERNVEEEFSTPGEVKASHILKRVPLDAKPEEVAKVKAAMEKVLKEARGGADFAKLAKKHSEDGTRDKGGDLGTFRREDMVPEFSEAAFALPPGGISDLVRTNFGFHIIKVFKNNPGIRKPLAEVKPKILQTLRSKRAERTLSLEAERLPKKIETEGLEAVASQFKLKVYKSGLFDDQKSLDLIGDSALLYGQIRSRKKGDAGVIKRNPLQGHIFYQIEEKKPSFVKPMDQVKAELAQAVRQQKSRELAVNAAREAYKTLSSPERFRAVALQYNLKIKSSNFTAIDQSLPEVGMNRQFSSTAFGLEKSKPYGLSIQGTDAHLIRLVKKEIPADKEEETNKREIGLRLEGQWAQYFLEQKIQELKEDADIEMVSPDFVANI